MDKSVGEKVNDEDETNVEQSKAKSIFWGIFKAISLLTLLYFFICSITFLEDAFKLVSGQNAGKQILFIVGKSN